MSPILVRPVREQLEHDRVIRLLEAKYRRKHEVAVNVGPEQTTAVQIGTSQLFPDLVLFSLEKGRKLAGTIEVETGESVTSLEAMAQWVPFSRLKAPFILYVPPLALDAVRRLCAAHGADPAEIWIYHVNFDQVRFTLAHRSASAVRLAESRKNREAKGAKAPAARGPLRRDRGDARKDRGGAPVARKVAKSKPATRPAAKPRASTKPGSRAVVRPSARKAAPKKPAAKGRPAKRR